MTGFGVAGFGVTGFGVGSTTTGGSGVTVGSAAIVGSGSGIGSGSTTAGASGLLIFVSLYERTAGVLGDRSVVETLGEKFPEDLCQRLTTSLRSQDVASGICDTIQHAATLLQIALPRTVSDVNELPDTLVLLD